MFATQLPSLADDDATGARGAVRAVTCRPGDKPLRMIEREIDDEEGRYLVQVAANADVIQTQIEQFEYALAATFLVLAVALIGSTALAVRSASAVARACRRAWRRSAAARPSASAATSRKTSRRSPPRSICCSTSNRAVVERARTQVGNLAHALKTPLSVIVNEAESSSPRLADKVREQAGVMRRQVSFYLDRARAAARAGRRRLDRVQAGVEGLMRTFEKIYRDRGIVFVAEAPTDLRFRGEPRIRPI